MNNELAVTIKNVSKTFLIPEDKKETLRSLVVSTFNQGKSKKFVALEDINLEIKKGEFIGIIGRNGSGKSTLLKLIAGIYSPDKGGEIKINGNMVPFLELGVGFNPELSGKENIYLNGTILGLTRKQIDVKFDEIVRFSELGEFIFTPVKNYSSGMKVRLAFSIAIQTDADIYILDEILGVGDGAFRSKSIGVIQKLIEEGKTVIYVSHGLGSVQKYCNRVVWLNLGKVVYEGETLSGIDQYRQSLLEIEKAQKAEEKEFDHRVNKVEFERVKVRTANENEVVIVGRLQRNEPVGECNVEFMISRDEDEVLFSTSTELQGAYVPEDKDFIYLRILDMNLLEGDYFIDARISTPDGQILFEEKKIAVFHAIGKDEYKRSKGIVHLNSKWFFKDE